ncbi:MULTISPECIES: DUF6141 family protein [Bacillaceae]|uniref:PH domain-containing protein n=1 Tax=Evansella alkalicola TaxID=745819 RepID=A0ABS6JWV6_9BACI|nr:MULTISPECIES: DUF6141 family protein [Bacillaceae]MBU9723051.1 hypothetical protein [Bacillus alkalicola]
MGSQSKVIYREIQKPGQIWAKALVFGLALLLWYAFIQQVILGVPVGTNPAPNVILIIFWLIFGVIFPLVLIAFLKLITEVRDDGVYIRFIPFHLHYRKFLYHDIQEYEQIVFSPLEFGGSGIRFDFQGGTSYTMHGKHGIKLHLNKETIVIGTQNPEEMFKAIASMKEKP